MLKFKIPRYQMSGDSTALTIVGVDFKNDYTRYVVRDGALGQVDEITDEVVIEFTAKDIYQMQHGTHLVGLNKINVGYDNNIYYYFDDLIVDTVSKPNNTFTCNVKKEMSLDVSSFHLETRLTGVYYDKEKKNWIFEEVNEEWLNKLEKEPVLLPKDSTYFFDVTDKNEKDEDVIVHKIMFFYENDCWDTKEVSPLDGGTGQDIKNVYYTKENYMVITCAPTHYFTTTMSVLATDTDPDSGVEVVTDEKIVYPEVNMNYRHYVEGKIIEDTYPQVCHMDDDASLSFNCDFLFEDGGEDDSYKEALKSIFADSFDFSDKTKIYPITYCRGGVFRVSRISVLYDSAFCSFDILYDAPTQTVQIPLSQKFETDMYHNDALNAGFVDTEIAKAINPIRDMEKDVYIPSICKNLGNQINNDYEECHKIVFNLHFREHRDDKTRREDWKCEKDCYWNGTRILPSKDGQKKVVDLYGRVFMYTNEENKKDKYDFFSYYGVAPDDSENSQNCDKDEEYDFTKAEYAKERKDRNQLKEYQSDTLSYLGFSTDDIKYQKNKLKKSFLRISFYDSDNIANQNLLQTSTIFLDSGNLFGKYAKNVETEVNYKLKGNVLINGIQYKRDDVIESKNFRYLDLESQKLCVVNGTPMAVVGTSKETEPTYTVYDKGGASVNREPMRKKVTTDFANKVGEYEDLRLSSQFVVEDKYKSKHSSEGFYFYTYKNGDNGVFPSDIYMRVEFNHAGYGRTIPFIMPYIRKNEGETGRYKDRWENKEKLIKTFDDICYDWSEIDYTKKEGDEGYIKDENDVGYGAIRYMKYSFIKWKYRYDKKTQRHIYYLDPDVYGTSVITGDEKTKGNNHGDNIILNLYEGKIR